MTAALSKLASTPKSDTTDERDLAAVLSPVRREARVDEVRVVEYTPFPRVHGSQRPRIGFTRDVSSLGMCVGVDEPEPLYTLLRVDVRQTTGQSIGASIGRVVWCSETRDGRFWLGLDLLCEAGDRSHATKPESEPTTF